MAEVIRMPKMSDTMEEGVIAAWLKKEGDTVKAGDILAEVETDKATMELEAYEDGTLLYIGVKEQEAAPINGIIAIIGEPGEDISSLLAESKQVPQQQEVGPEKIAAEESSTTPANTVPTEPAPEQVSSASSIFASPLAKKMAQEKGYELAQIQGTGEGGRIIKRDIESFSASSPVAQHAPTITLPPVVGEERYEDIPVSGMRKTIAKRLAESKFSAPHFYLTISIDMDQVVAARPSINEYAPVKVSFNDIVIKAAAMALRQHPTVNASWLTDKIRYNQHIHIGIAVAIEDGLVVPVVRFADTKSLAHIATEVKAFAQKAANKQLMPQDAGGDTFSISNLGMKGIESFTAIVNPPASCNLAIGAIKQVPVVKNGEIVPGNVMKATLSCDHRVVDGAVGAAFLQTFRALLEDPLRMLIH
ncbi:MAG: pyruvate dehydrogenase complex dihydrolipoamide acetyltransferase [Bacteroidota bacterium]